MTLIFVTAGAAAALLTGVYGPQTGWVVPAGLVSLGVWVVLLLLRRKFWFRPIIFGAALACLWLAVYGMWVHGPAEALENRTIRMEAVVTDWPEKTRSGFRVLVRGGEDRPVKTIFYGDEALKDLRPGDRISTVAYCTPAGEFHGEESLYYPARGILLKARGYGPLSVTPVDPAPPRYGLTRLAQSIRTVIDRLYPEDQAGFLHALLTGDKNGIDEIDRHGFNRAGVGHVVVISGLHVSFLVGILSLVFRPGKRGSLAVIVTATILFTLMTGAAPGTIRASILCFLALLAQRMGRDYHNLTGLSAALLFLLALNPYSIADAGLQFSFLSTLGILSFGQRWNSAWIKKLPKARRKWLKPVVSVTAISLGAMLFTVPLSALYFGRFSLLAPLANLLTSWAVAAAFAGGALSVLLGALWLPLGQAAAFIVGVPIRWFMVCSDWVCRIPLASLSFRSIYYLLWTIFVYGLVLVYLLVPVKGKRPFVPICACVLTLCLSVLLTSKTVQRSDLAVTALDVGQGQCVAVTSGRACALLDCGGSKTPGDTAASYLLDTGHSTLDMLVLSHFHADHAGGVPELMKRVKVRAIAVPDADPQNPLRQEIEALAQAQGVPIYYITERCGTALGKAHLTFLPPPAELGSGSNEQCLSVLCANGDWEALITGDLPGEGERALMQRDRLPNAELLVVSHHGSGSSSDMDFLKTITPEVALISVGYNTYGQPAPETLERLNAVQAQVYRTDEVGTVTIYAGKGES